MREILSLMVFLLAVFPIQGCSNTGKGGMKKNGLKGKRKVVVSLDSTDTFVLPLVKTAKKGNTVVLETYASGKLFSEMANKCPTCFANGVDPYSLPSVMVVKCIFEGVGLESNETFNLKKYRLRACEPVWEDLSEYIKINVFARSKQMKKQFDAVSGQTIETFVSPESGDWVEVKYGDKKFTWARRIKLEIRHKDKRPTLIRLEGVFWRTELMTIAENSDIVNMKTDELIKFKPGKDILVTFEGGSVLRKMLESELDKGKTVSEVVQEVGADGFPVFLNLANYKLKNIVQLIDEKKDVIK